MSSIPARCHPTLRKHEEQREREKCGLSLFVSMTSAESRHLSRVFLVSRSWLPNCAKYSFCLSCSTSFSLSFSLYFSPACSLCPPFSGILTCLRMIKKHCQASDPLRTLKANRNESAWGVGGGPVKCLNFRAVLPFSPRHASPPWPAVYC